MWTLNALVAGEENEYKISNDQEGLSILVMKVFYLRGDYNVCIDKYALSTNYKGLGRVRQLVKRSYKKCSGYPE